MSFVGSTNLPVLSDALYQLKANPDAKLVKNNSLSRLSHSVGPKKKLEGALSSYQ